MLKPTIHNLRQWLLNISKAPLKPDQKLAISKTYVIPKVLYGLQQPGITGRTLREADRLIRYHIKSYMHLNVHTPDAALYAKIRDGGLGITQLWGAIPKIYLGRLLKLLEHDNDNCLQFVIQSEQIHRLMTRMQDLAGETPHNIKWAEAIKNGPLTSGLKAAVDDHASRAWLEQKPQGWTGRDFVRAVQLRTANLPTAGIMSNPPDRRRCRAGCNKVESLSHVLQGSQRRTGNVSGGIIRYPKS